MNVYDRIYDYPLYGWSINIKNIPISKCKIKRDEYKVNNIRKIPEDLKMKKLGKHIDICV